MAEAHRDEISKLEALYSDNPEGRVFTLLAEAYRKAGELDHAREVLEGGIKRHSGYASAYVVLGRVLLDQQQGPAAEDAFRRVLELDPENLVALRALGDRARTTGRHQEAIKYYRELLMLDPSDEELQQTVASLEMDIGADAQAASAAAPARDGRDWNAPAPEPAGARDSQIAASGDFGNISIDASAASSLPEGTNFGDISMQSGSGNMLSLNSTPEEDLDGSLGSMDLSGRDAPAGEFGDLPDFGGFSLDTGTPDLGGFSDAPGGAPDDVGIPPLSFEPLEDASVGATELPMLDAPAPEPQAAEDLEWSPNPVDMLETPLPGEPLAEPSFRPYAPDEPDPGAFPFSSDGVVEESSPGLQGWSADDLPADEPPTPAAVSREDSFGAIPDEGEQAPWEPPAAPAEGELATETMAELYTSQGLHARAVEVYHALLRERPDDERLYTKLRQAEFAVSSALIVREEPKEPEEPESAWTAAPSTAGQQQTPYAWADEEEPDAGPQIGQYFSTLLSWRSATPRPQRVEPVKAPAAPVAPVPSAPGRADAQTRRQSAAEAAAEADTDLSWLDDPEPRVQAAASPVAVPAAPAAQPGPAAPAIEEDLAWLYDDEQPAAGTAARAPGAPSAKQEGSGEGEGGDDDDLEMFRAWLQSLKR